MKVLFAVSNEEISESIVKRYQREYKEIISYKNVYYFNAILKELQKDKSYDRIVISEELEAFTNTQYEQIDKFIFDKLDSISDEASNLKGEDIPIVLICSDRREKSEEMFIKLFGIGIYNALIGNDRSVENVCKLLNKPRIKKEAKIYYKIDSEDVLYQPENENDVSEVEIQNILAHYKRLGKDEKRYVDSFNNIASQYNDVQLRIISKFLPLNVRAVLEEKSPKYQQIMTFNSRVSDSLRASQKVEEQEKGTSERLLKTSNNDRVIPNSVVIPSSINSNKPKKLIKAKPQLIENFEEIDDEEEVKEINNIEEIENFEEINNIEEIENFEEIDNEEEIQDNTIKNEVDLIPEESIIEQIPEQPKRGRGRPRKIREEQDVPEQPKRGRGRPRKNPVVQETEEEMVLPGISEEVDIEDDETILPGMSDETINIIEEDETILPGFNEDFEEDETNVTEENEMLPEIESTEIKEDNVLSKIEDNVDISSLLTSSKKVACFVGTSKNGTSFIVNNLAQITSSRGIDTAILDLTKNGNSYYIYTKNEEELRRTAINSINNLIQGHAEGIKANKNLTVYTSLPDETEGIENAGKILETLLKNHSLVLIDCDFNTPIEYFEKTKEIYLVQTFDILTIQPLTAFLRELKAKNVLDEQKLRVILNKTVKLRGVNEKTIIGGMAYYNDPAMSFMTELFNKNTIKYISIPFDEEVYAKYLESVINCEISTKGYNKKFVQIFNELSNMVYPLVSGKSTYVPPKVESNGFTPNMNSTLKQMKNRY